MRGPLIPPLPVIMESLKSIPRAHRMPRERLDELRDSLLRRLVRHAYASVPYYREWFDRHQVRPNQIRSARDLERIPVTDKTGLQSQPVRNVLAHGLDPARLLSLSTSGSDGRPLTIYRTWLEQSLLHLFRLRAQRWVGLRATDRYVSISLIREPLALDDKRVGRLLQFLKLYRRSRVDVFQDVDAIVDDLRRLRPDVIGGYPGVVARVADRLRELGEDWSHPSFLLSGAEALAPYRRQIEDGFGARVFDLYGCQELNLVAWECRATGELHTGDDFVIVELLDGDRPVNIGERGEVVVTGLYTYSMPFIRYRLGDLAVRGEDRCSCGEPFATLRDIEGRTFEKFVLPDGRVVHPHQLGRMVRLEGGRAIRQYQIVHERPELVLIRIVPDPSRALDLETLGRRAREVLGPAVRCEIRRVPEIPMEGSGKHRLYKPLADRPGPPG